MKDSSLQYIFQGDLIYDSAPGPLSDREITLARLTRRYFQSHGPATEQDFAWWSGLPLKDVRRGIALTASGMRRVSVAGISYWCGHDATALPKGAASFLLPGFDEFLLGYRNRHLMLDPQYAPQITPGNNGIFLPVVVIRDRVAGSWKRQSTKKETRWEFKPFIPWSAAAIRSLRKPQRQLEAFWESSQR